MTQHVHHAPLGPGDHVVKVSVGDRERRALVHVPPGYDPAKPTPLVLIFHGAGGTGRLYLGKNGWSALSDREGFLAVAPDGTPPDRTRSAQYMKNPLLWNDGSGRGSTGELGTDEPAFVRALLDRLAQRLNVDRQRVYATGHSNGGVLTFLLAEVMGDRFAAIASVAGLPPYRDFRPAHPLPTLFLIGTLDPITPLDGGPVTSPWTGRISQRPAMHDTLTAWATALGCPGQPKKSHPREGVEVWDYGTGRRGCTMKVYVIAGQGHGWPGGESSGQPENLIGPSVGAVHATETIWEFFRATNHPSERRSPNEPGGPFGPPGSFGDRATP
jgi:polyhydroxybutyrate depolymerase